MPRGTMRLRRRRNPQGTQAWRSAAAKVGITYCFHTRADQHSMTALWWRHARRVTCELFPSRSMATCAERHVIHDEEPIHNGHRKQPPKKPFEPDEWFFKQQGKRWVGVDPEEWTIGPNGLERSYGDQAV